jgi:hypothetical protein
LETWKVGKPGKHTILEAIVYVYWGLIHSKNCHFSYWKIKGKQLENEGKAKV